MFQFLSEIRKKLMSQFERSQVRVILSYLGKSQSFCSIWSSADWMGPTHIGEGNLLYSVYQFKY